MNYIDRNVPCFSATFRGKDLDFFCTHINRYYVDCTLAFAKIRFEIIRNNFIAVEHNESLWIKTPFDTTNSIKNDCKFQANQCINCVTNLEL